ncbi:MAG: hypothetical protein KA796_03240 [Chryseobacterium sp.]|nr:hypothetical protein [Chryseobacterium sp.]MBP7498864.1 hypothetical protein [Chryseobacterium sp.]
MKQIYIIFILFFTFGNVFSQNIVIDKNLESKKKIESIILQSKNFGKDTIALKSYLSPLIKSSDKNLHIVYYNMLASGFASANESINKTSNHNFSKSLALAKSGENHGLEIWTLVNYAFYLYDYKKTTEALQVYLDADNKIRQTEASAIILPSDSFKKIGYFMGTIGDTNEAIHYLQKAEQFAEPNSKELAAIQDNIGFYYLEQNQIENAKRYLSKAETVAKNINDQIRYAKVLGNLGLLEYKKGNLDKAVELLRKDLTISKKFRSHNNTNYARILLSKILIDKNQINEAKSLLSEAGKFAESKMQLKKDVFEIEQLKLRIAQQENNPEQELISLRKLNELEKQLTNSDSEKNLERSNILAQKERYANKLSLANAQFEKEQLKNKAIIVVSVLLFFIIILLIIFNRKQLKTRKDKYDKTVLRLELEKVKSEQKFLETNQTLSSYSTYLTEKNEQIELLNKELWKIKNSSSSSIEKEKQQLQKLLDSHLMTDESWRNFKDAFQKEYPDYFQTLLADFPDLTESNLRITSLMKLGLSNQEISSLLGITIEAVKKSKQRLRKRFGEKYEDLSLGN